MARQRIPALTAVLTACVPLALLVACGSDDGGAGGERDDHPAADAVAGEVTAAGIPPERCDANKAAGTITYLSGFDFSASASIVEVIVAEHKGYFDDMCLDVELKPSFSVGQLHPRGRQRGPVRQRRLVRGDRRLQRRQRCRPRRRRRGGEDRHRRAHRQGWRGHHAGRSRGQDHRGEGQAATVAQGHAGPGRAGRGHRLHDGGHRGLRSAGPHRAARTRRLHRLQVQRARPAGAGRRAVHPARSLEGRHPGVVRHPLHERRVPQRASDGGAGLRAGRHAGHGGRHRRSGRGRRRPRST